MLDFLPEKPVSPLQSLAEAGVSPSDLEPALSSLGLASWWPPGRVQVNNNQEKPNLCINTPTHLLFPFPFFQYALEWLHVSVDIPWWGCIVIGVLYYVIFFRGNASNADFFSFVLPFLSHSLHAPADVPSGDHGPEERRQGGELRARDAGTSLSHTFF